MRVDDCCVVHASVISVWACLALRLRRVSAKQSEKSRQTLCGGRAFGSRAQRDKRANELRAAKTREARSGPRFAYLQPASTYHGPKQAHYCVVYLLKIKDKAFYYFKIFKAEVEN